MGVGRAAVAESVATIALEMAAHMEALALVGEWDEIENIVVRLRSAIANIPEAERRSVVLSVQRSTEKVAIEARKARQNLTGKISELRRGQAARKAYELR